MPRSKTERLIEALILLLDRDGLPRDLPPMAQIADAAGMTEDEACAIFPTSTDLMCATGIGAWMRLADAITRRLVAVPGGDPVEQLIRFGEVYLEWAFADPALFRIINSRTLIILQRDEDLARVVQSVRRLIISLIRRAVEAGALSPDRDPQMLLLGARAFVYGLARMYVDDHFAEWVPDADPLPMCKSIFRDYVGQIMCGDPSQHEAG